MSCTTDKKDTDRDTDTAANDTKKPELQNNWKGLYGKNATLRINVRLLNSIKHHFNLKEILLSLIKSLY